MKKKLFTYVFLFASMALLSKIKAQNYYNLVPSMSTYTDLVDPSMLNNQDSIAEAYYASGDVVFPVYGYEINFNQDPSVPSLGAYITRGGYVAVYESPSYDYTMVFHGAFSSYVQRDATSSISVKYEGLQGNGILKFQWKNMGIEDMPDSNFVNFQIWFDQSQKTISYHYGTSNVTGAFAPVIGLFRAPNDFSVLTHASYIQGDIHNPSSLTLSNPGMFGQITTVNAFPPANTVYTFSKNTTGIAEASMNNLYPVSVYPNPATRTLNLNTRTQQAQNILITDLAGKTVMHLEQQKTDQPIDLTSLNSGLYWITVDDNKPVKFIKQ